jgi:hypothetical protein
VSKAEAYDRFEIAWIEPMADFYKEDPFIRKEIFHHRYSETGPKSFADHQLPLEHRPKDR